jgi:hypothetical protein
MKTRQVKMKMLAKVLKNISNVLFWVTSVLFVVFLLASIVVLFVPGKDMVISPNLTGSLQTSIGGTMVVKFDLQSLGVIIIKPFLQAMFMWISFVSLMVSVLLYELKRILKTVVADNPFEKGNSKNLTVIAFTLLVGSLILPIFEGRIAMAVIDVLKISNFNVNFMIDWNLLMAGILILILAGVFQYGNYLQEEVDSTL